MAYIPKLSNLSDVAISSATDLDLLSYNNGTGKWVNKSISTLGLSKISVANQAQYRLITATNVTDALNAEANLTFSGTYFTITGYNTVKSNSPTFSTVVTANSGFPNSASSFNLNRTRGTLASPTAVLSGDWLGSQTYCGLDSSANQYIGVRSYAITTEDATASACGTAYVIETIVTGGTTAAERFQIMGTGAIKFNGAYSFPTTLTGSSGYVLGWAGSGTALSWMAMASSSQMVWPSGAGIAIYSGSSAWGTSITDNHGHWDTAYTHSQAAHVIYSNSANAYTADNAWDNGHYYCNGSISLYGQTDGALFSQAYSSSWVGQLYIDYRTGRVATRSKNSGTWMAWLQLIDSTNNSTLNGDTRNTRGVTRLYRSNNDSDYSVQTTWDGTYWLLQGYNADTYHAGARVAYADYAASAGSATWSTYVSSPDGDRVASNKLPTTTARGVRFDFATAASVGMACNYAGVMTYTPWDGTTESTGDASYQLAFGGTAANGGGVPALWIRKGIDSTWNSWYIIYHSGNVATFNADTLDTRHSTAFVNYNYIPGTTNANTYIGDYSTVISEYRWSNTPNTSIAILATHPYSADWIAQEYYDLVAGSNVDKYIRYRYNGTTWTLWYKFYHSGNFTGATASGTSGYLAKFTGSSSLGNSVLYESSAKIGINTTVPRGVFESVSGSANTDADVAGSAGCFTAATPTGQSSIVSIESNSTIAADTGGVLGFGGRYSGTGYTNWASIKGLKADGTVGNYGGYLAFFTRTTGYGSAERMRIDTNGNVGIGTTSPGSKLDVNGATNITGTCTVSSDLQLTGGNVTSPTSINFYPSGGTVSLQIQSTQVAVSSGKNLVVASGTLLVGDTGASSYKIWGLATGDDGICMETTGTSNAAYFRVSSGNGTTSGRYAYASFIANETAPQRWDFGMVGNKHFQINNNTLADWALDIDPTNNLVSVNHSLFTGGYAQVVGVLYSQNNFCFLNKSSAAWITWATRDTSGSEAIMALSVKGITDANLKSTVNHTVYADANGLLTNSSSDYRLKENILALTHSVDAMGLLKNDSIYPITFDWKDHRSGRDIGFTAQMFEGIPGLTGVNNDGMLSLNYDKLTALLWEQNKELLKRIEELEQLIKN